MNEEQRENVLKALKTILDKPVRWAKQGAPDLPASRTVQVFNAEVEEHKHLLGQIDRYRKVFHTICGGPLVVIFHSQKQTKERYPEMLEG